MNGTFNGQILIDKLSKLNSSQQSIETLSHWCIFHRKNAHQVVETWGQQFHSAPRSQRVSFLYLANDILQNSRRKGMEFVNEFWKVLPDALNDVVDSGDEFGRSAALRLIDIWEDRKVFGSRGQALKDEIFGRKIGSINRSSTIPIENNEEGGSELQKLISSYQRVYEGPVNEAVVLNRCQHTIGLIDKVEREIAGRPGGGDVNGSQIAELESHHTTLRECVEELKMAEASRASLVLNLRGALQEQESKLEQVRQRLQLRLGQVGIICQRLTSGSNGQLPKSENGSTGDSGESRKMAAAAMAAKLTSSNTSAEMLSYVLSSFAAEGKEEVSNDAKRPRLEMNPPPPLPPLPPPPPPLPPMPPLPQYVQGGSMYGHAPFQRPPPLPFVGLPPPPPPRPGSRQ